MLSKLLSLPGKIWWQISAVIILNFPFIQRLSCAWLPVPALNCYACPLAQGACPLGTIQHFLVIGTIPFFAMGAVILFGIIAGRFYCSHICPFGFLQDMLKKMSKINLRIPFRLEYLKYASLIILAIVLPVIVKEPFFCTLCPAGTLEAGIPIVGGEWLKVKFSSGDTFSSGFGILSMIGWWFWFKLGLLAAIILMAIFMKRPFCRMFCPLGAIFGLFNRLSFFIHPQPDTPGQVYHLKSCPVGIIDKNNVDSPSCIKCRECYKKQ